MNEAWQAHVDFMYEHLGRRDPECFWCHEPVVMALQGFHGGGTWTTNRDGEGPLGSPWPGSECPASPDGQHDVLTP